MQNINRILLIAIFAVLSNISLFGQEVTCPTPKSWDYPDYPYNGVFTSSVILSINPDCILHYKYCWRTTPGYFDFAICEVALEGDCEGYKSVDTLIKYAATDLITNIRPWGNEVKECPDNSSTYWRQSTAACFSDFYWNPKTLKWTSYPCDNDGRERWCWTYYKYCWKWVNGERVLEETIVQRSQGGATCPPELILKPPYSPKLKCNSRCQ